MSDSLPVFAAGATSAGVLASLPASYHHSEAASGGVTVIGGSRGWPRAAATAIRAGAAGVIVTAPEPEDLSPLRSGGLIVVDSIWATNPVAASAGAAFRSAASPGSRLECRVRVAVGRSLAAVLLDQLSLIRALLAPATELRILHRSEHGFVAEASAAGIAVDLSAICTDSAPQQASARLLTVDGGVHVQIPDGTTAQPALLTVTGPDGTLLAPTRYESGHRAAWRRLHHLLSTGERCTDLDDLEADIATASIYPEG
jgi:hypothetical protein